jgi:hypothetical protein
MSTMNKRTIAVMGFFAGLLSMVAVAVPAKPRKRMFKTRAARKRYGRLISVIDPRRRSDQYLSNLPG